MTSLSIGPLTPPDQEAVSALLSEAFAADPAYQYFLEGCCPADLDIYRKRLVRFIVAYHCASKMPVWGVTHQGVLVACALLEVPTPNWRKAAALFRHMPLLIGRVPWSSIERMNRYARVSRQDLPKSIDHYLVKIGVALNQQGQGFGKSLIEAMVAHCRTRGQAIGLDTENSANVPLYQHLGFRLHDEREQGTLRLYRMYLPLEQPSAHEDH